MRERERERETGLETGMSRNSRNLCCLIRAESSASALRASGKKLRVVRDELSVLDFVAGLRRTAKGDQHKMGFLQLPSSNNVYIPGSTSKT